MSDFPRSMVRETEGAKALKMAGLNFPAMIVRGEVHAVLQTMAHNHCCWMARALRSGYDGFTGRLEAAQREFGPGVDYREIGTEVGPFGFDTPLDTIAHDAFRLMQRSPSMWRTVGVKPRWVGYDMKRGANSVWYVWFCVVD